MNGKGARIARAEKALEGQDDPNDYRVRFVRALNSVAGSPGVSVLMLHFRYRAARARDARRANGDEDPATVAASHAASQASFDGISDEELAASLRALGERLLAIHERDGCAECSAHGYGKPLPAPRL